MSVTYLDQLSTETSPLSSDKLLGVRGTGVGSERLYRVDSFDAAGTAELEVQKLFSPGGTFKTEYFPAWTGENFVTPEVTSNPITNGNNLRTSVVEAFSRTAPNEIARSETNPVVIQLAPGVYDLGVSSPIEWNRETGTGIILSAMIPNTAVITGTATVADANGCLILFSNQQENEPPTLYIRGICFQQKSTMGINSGAGHKFPSIFGGGQHYGSWNKTRFDTCSFIGDNIYCGAGLTYDGEQPYIDVVYFDNCGDLITMKYMWLSQVRIHRSRNLVFTDSIIEYCNFVGLGEMSWFNTAGSHLKGSFFTNCTIEPSSLSTDSTTIRDSILELTTGDTLSATAIRVLNCDVTFGGAHLKCVNATGVSFTHCRFRDVPVFDTGTTIDMFSCTLPSNWGSPANLTLARGSLSAGFCAINTASGYN